MSGYNSKKKPGVKKDIKQPTIPLPSQPGYHGQDLASLLDSRENKIDMNWLEQVGSNQPGGINNGMGGFSTKPNNDPVKSNNGQNPMNSTYADMLLNNSQGGFADFLASLGIQQQTGLTGTQRDAWNNYLLQTLVQYYLTQENRQYDRALQLDQRLYDTPTNQLARIMGAGISRDAAIQLLSGGSGSGAGSGAGVPYSQPAGAGDMSAANQAGMMPYQAATAIANSVFNGLGTIIGLTNLGFSIPLAIEQTKSLRYDNVLKGQNLAAYQSAGQAYKILNSIGAASESFSSVASVADAISAAAKGGNPDALKFVADGGLDNMRLNAPFASKVIGDLYNADRSSADKARTMDQYFLQQDLQNSLLELEGQLGHRQLEMMSKQLLQADEQLKLLMQQFRRGEVEISIAGEVLNAHKYENVYGKYESEAFEAAMTTTYDGEPTGQDLLAESTWRELYGHWRKLAIEQSPENIDAYTTFLQNNFDAACYCAMIKAASTKQLADVWNSDDNNSASVWNRFTNIFFGTKTDQIVNLGTNAAEVGAIMYGASPLSRQGSVRRVKGL